MENVAAVAVNEVPRAGRKIGRTCHQCRQKFPMFKAICKNMRGRKQCPLKYCHRCILNRYGESEEVVETINDWKCPRCRDICNCSEHMKKKGLNPLGRQINNARAEGFSSVHDMMEVNGHPDSNESASPEKAPNMDEVYGVSHQPVENHVDATKHSTNEPTKELPAGNLLTSVAGVELPPGDVGNALQFLQFCKTFGTMFEVRDGMPEGVLRDIMAGFRTPAELSLVIQFHIQLLTLIKNLWSWPTLSRGDDFNSWLKALNDCIANSSSAPEEISSLRFNSNDEYVRLCSSEKLRLLVLLCDESLQTKDMKAYMDHEIDEFYNKKRAAKDKKKEPDHDEATVSGSNVEPGDMDVELPEDVKLPFGCTRKPDVLRADTFFADSNRQVYWNLKAVEKSTILRQDLSDAEPSERWYGLGGEDAKEVINHIKLKRVKRRRRTNRATASKSPDPEEGYPNPEAPSCGIPESSTSKEGEVPEEGYPNPEAPSCEIPESSTSKEGEGTTRASNSFP